MLHFVHRVEDMQVGDQCGQLCWSVRPARAREGGGQQHDTMGCSVSGCALASGWVGSCTASSTTGSAHPAYGC